MNEGAQFGAERPRAYALHREGIPVLSGGHGHIRAGNKDGPLKVAVGTTIT